MQARCPVRRVRIGKPRRGLVIDEPYKAWIRKQRCICCGIQRYVEAAHVGLRGYGQKCSDRETLPLCGNHHVQGRESHHLLGKRFWIVWGLDRARLIEQYNRQYEQEKAP